MNIKTIPRKHRKHIQNLVDTYKNNLGKMDEVYTNWDEFLKFNLTATNDGYLATNNKEYQTLLWLIELTNFIKDLQEFDALEELK